MQPFPADFPRPHEGTGVPPEPPEVHMTTPKEAIQEILSKLDIGDDTNWTEDGSPALGVVRKLANDPAISRAQINDAKPGFVRMVGEDVAAAASAPGPLDEAVTVEALPDADGRFTDEQMRDILNRRVRDAEQNLTDAMTRVSEATAEVVQCQKRLGRMHDEHDRQFPKITAAANIKAHLEAQGRLSEENAGLFPIQAALMNRKRPVAGRVANTQANPLLPRRSGAVAAA